MTEQVDLDAIEALRRYREAELPDAGYAYLADALESTLAELRQSRSERDLHRSNYERLLIEKGAREAELRQERERSRDAEERMRLCDRANDEEIDRTDKAEAALSRAEETIEKAITCEEHTHRIMTDRKPTREDSSLTWRILTEYDKQKEAARTARGEKP